MDNSEIKFKIEGLYERIKNNDNWINTFKKQKKKVEQQLKNLLKNNPELAVGKFGKYKYQKPLTRVELMDLED